MHPVDTAAVTDRRALRFATLVEALADAERLAAADLAGRLRRAGNWTAGQVFSHLAAWMNYAFDGYPVTPEPELAARASAALRTRVLDGGLLPGVRLRGVEAGTTGAEDLPTMEALERLRAEWDRTQRSSPTRPHAIFGPMSHAEWIRLHLRHCELHQSFLHPLDGAGVGAAS